MALLGIGLPFAFTTGLVACVFALALFGPAALTLDPRAAPTAS